jgi:hypothetical protein
MHAYANVEYLNLFKYSLEPAQEPIYYTHDFLSRLKLTWLVLIATSGLLYCPCSNSSPSLTRSCTRQCLVRNVGLPLDKLILWDLVHKFIHILIDEVDLLK